MSVLIISPKQAEEFKTPVKHLWPHIHKGISALEKETKEELCNSGARLTISIKESDEFVCGVEPRSGAVGISTGALQFVWSISYLNFLYYCRVVDAGGPFKSVTIDPTEDDDLRNAMKLFEWSLNVVSRRCSGEDWPEELPRPEKDPKKDSWEMFADEVTLESFGFILLHELAHVVLKHQGFTSEQRENNDIAHWSLEQEREADAQAIEWFFRDLPNPSDGRRIKREIGVASILLGLVAKALFSGNWGGRTYPPTWQRLHSAVTSIEPDKEHVIYAFLSHLSTLYKSMAGKSGSQTPQMSSFAEAFEHFIDDLSRENAGI